MKKIISFFVVAMMLVTMSLTAFAADTGVTVAAEAVEVETGTASATINMEISFAEAGNLAMLSWNFVVPEGIALESIDFAELSAKAGKFSNESDGDLVMVYDDDDDMQMVFAAKDSVNIAMTFTIADPSVEAEYEISFDEPIVEDIDGNALVEEIAPVTITVMAAAPAGPEYSYKAATVTKDVQVAKGGEFVDTFNDAVIATASVSADTTAEDFGIIFLKDGNYAKVEDELAHISMKSAAIEGEGTFEFGVVMHGIPAEVIDNITAQYYIYE